MDRNRLSSSFLLLLLLFFIRLIFSLSFCLPFFLPSFFPSLFFPPFCSLYNFISFLYSLVILSPSAPSLSPVLSFLFLLRLFLSLSSYPSPPTSCCMSIFSPTGQLPSRCEKQREYALQKHVVGRWIPRCRLDGSYEPIQCDRGWNCWCVDFTGKEIAQSRTRGWPNCGPPGQRNKGHLTVLRRGTCHGPTP